MPLVTTKEMFAKAYSGGYAIGAFNVNNMETIQGVVEAGKELEAPLIIQITSGANARENHTYLMKLVEAAVIESGLPICLHLDHCNSYELCRKYIDNGFNSVMIDASSKPFAENIEITRKVVEYAHDHGVVVEAELGAISGVEEEVNVSAEDSFYTRPEEVEEFVSRTGCDSLAIAIGTSHGAYKFKPGTRPQLRFDVLWFFPLHSGSNCKRQRSPRRKDILCSSQDGRQIFDTISKTYGSEIMQYTTHFYYCGRRSTLRIRDAGCSGKAERSS